MAISVNFEKCTVCGDCIDICPVETIKIKKGKIEIGDECVECESCIVECPNDALSVLVIKE